MEYTKTVIRSSDGIELNGNKYIEPKEIDKPKELRYFATIFSYNLTKEQVNGLKSSNKREYMVQGDSWFFNCMLREKISDMSIIPISYSIRLVIILADKALKRLTERGNILIGSYAPNKKIDDKHKFNDIEVGDVCKEFLDDYEKVKGKACIDKESLEDSLWSTSRNQAVISVKNTELYVENLGSNGTTRFMGTLNNRNISNCSRETRLIGKDDKWAGISFGMPIADLGNDIRGHSLIMMITRKPLIEGREDLAEKLK